MNVFEIVENIRTTKGTKAKEQILRDNIDNRDLRKLFCWAYDWTKTIGITASVTVPLPDEQISDSRDDLLQNVVESLQDRRITGDLAKKMLSERLAHWGLDEQEILVDFLNKKPRLGIGETVLHKVAPGLVPKFNGCMLAEKWDGKPIKFPVRVDPKIDGMRCLVVYENGEAKAFTREGNALPQVQFICDQLSNQLKDNPSFGEAAKNGLVFDGELFAETWGQTLRLTKTESDIDRSELMYNCFDSIPFKDWESGKCKERPETRFSTVSKMEGLPNVRIVYGEMVNSMEELMEYYDKCLKDGFEGIMIKDLSALYECRRSKAWIKLKPEETIDYPIIGLFEGKGRLTGTLGGLTLRKQNGDALGVGSGFTDAVRAELWERGNELIGKMCEVKFQPGREGAAEFAVFSKIRDDL